MHIVVNVMAKYSHVSMYSDNGHCIFVLGDKIHRTPGDRWMIHGPTDYILRTEIGNTQRRLDFNQCNTTHTHTHTHAHTHTHTRTYHIMITFLLMMHMYAHSRSFIHDFQSVM